MRKIGSSDSRPGHLIAESPHVGLLDRDLELAIQCPGPSAKKSRSRVTLPAFSLGDGLLRAVQSLTHLLLCDLRIFASTPQKISEWHLLPGRDHAPSTEGLPFDIASRLSAT